MPYSLQLLVYVLHDPAANDRMTLLRVLQGGADPLFQLNPLAVKLLTRLRVSAKWQRQLPLLLSPDQIYTEGQLDALLDRHLPPKGEALRRHIKEAMAIATYRTQTAYPVVDLLLCDDAAQFNHLTDQLALCWVHEYRHYKTLIPRFLTHLNLLKAFTKDFWTSTRSVGLPRLSKRDRGRAFACGL